MIRTAGKIIVICLVWIPVLLRGDLSLSITDEYGEPLKEVQVGRPFMIQVTIKESTLMELSPRVTGMDQFVVQDTMKQFEMINGVTKVTHNYRVVAKKQGEYTIGPAIVSGHNQEERSNIASLIVGTQEVHAGEKAHAPPLLRLTIDKDRVVKGEKIVGTLRFYYIDPSSEKLRHFIEQSVEGVNRKKARAPRQGTENINDTEYNYIELEWDMYPQKSGMLTIPAFGAEYEVKIKRDHLWGGLGRLFGAFSEPKRIYSNAVTVQVDDVPEPQTPINGIGRFDSFHISAHPASVAQGEGTLVSIIIKGSFDPDQVTFAGLQGMPQELRSFPSQEVVDESLPGRDVVKRFEYIVQGMDTGSWQIPSQTFDYYDVESRSYKTLKTAPLSIAITAGKAPQALPFSVENTSSEEGGLYVLATSEATLTPPKVMPWWLFFILIVVPLVIWVFQEGLQSVQRYRKKNYRARRSYNAFIIAKDRLQKLKAADNASRLYTVFIELFADKWQIPLTQITTEYIQQRLHDVGMEEEQLVEWNDFFEFLSEQAFGAQRTKKEIEYLFKQAEEWLEILQRLL